MQSFNLSFLAWYRAMLLMSTTKKGFSAKETQRQLGLKRYEPVWIVVLTNCLKLWATVMRKYTLKEMVEKDEGYFTVESSEVDQ